ncbi:hypothetical protein EOM86_13330 [Candidatus Nomurabacteria bacterium]|nr:hypothetical protein [Candidatus Nomurabacteria bacterium]
MRWHKNRFGPGITPGYSENGKVCRIVFDPTAYDNTRALSWLDEQDYIPIEFSPFSIESTRENEEVREITKESPRTLSIPWKEAGGNLEKRPDGSLLVKGVKMLGSGTWTDSAKKTPLTYSEDVLKRNAGNWVDDSHWSRHLGGVPRRVGEMIGKTINPRYEGGHVVADIEYHGLSQDSRDTIAMIEAGVANYVSVEHGGRERWNVGKKQYEAEELFFTGSATVNRGACQTCKIRENEEAPAAPEIKEPEIKEPDNMVELAELEKTIKEQGDQIRQLTELVKSIAEKKPEEPGKELEARITALENDPVIKMGVKEEPRALEAPPFVITTDRGEMRLVGA